MSKNNGGNNNKKASTIQLNNLSSLQNGIRLPYLGIVAKYFGRPLIFEVQIIDSLNTTRRIRFSNISGVTRNPITKNTIFIPIQMDLGWNELKIDLDCIIHSAYGTIHKETTQIEIFPNCYLRAVYFSSMPVPNSTALNIVQSVHNKVLVSNENNQNPKFTEYKANHFRIQIPTQFQEFVAHKLRHNIELSVKKSVRTIPGNSTSRAPKTRPSNDKTQEAVVFSISPILPRSTPQILDLKEASKALIHELKEAEKCKNTPRPKSANIIRPTSALKRPASASRSKSLKRTEKSTPNVVALHEHIIPTPKPSPKASIVKSKSMSSKIYHSSANCKSKVETPSPAKLRSKSLENPVEVEHLPEVKPPEIIKEENHESTKVEHESEPDPEYLECELLYLNATKHFHPASNNSSTASLKNLAKLDHAQKLLESCSQGIQIEKLPEFKVEDPSIVPDSQTRVQIRSFVFSIYEDSIPEEGLASYSKSLENKVPDQDAADSGTKVPDAADSETKVPDAADSETKVKDAADSETKVPDASNFETNSIHTNPSEIDDTSSERNPTSTNEFGIGTASDNNNCAEDSGIPSEFFGVYEQGKEPGCFEPAVSMESDLTNPTEFQPQIQYQTDDENENAQELEIEENEVEEETKVTISEIVPLIREVIEKGMEEETNFEQLYIRPTIPEFNSEYDSTEEEDIESSKEPISEEDLNNLELTDEDHELIERMLLEEQQLATAPPRPRTPALGPPLVGPLDLDSEFDYECI